MSSSARLLTRNLAAAARLSPARRIHSLFGAATLRGRLSAGAQRAQSYSASKAARRGLATASAAPQAEPQRSNKGSEEGAAASDKSAEHDSTHHAVVSTFDLFSIGVGPSSSHTVGPMRAGKIFVQDLVDHKVLDSVASIKVDLYGSLALTGIGHGTPNATLMGLEGELPETVPTETIIPRVEAMHETNTITLNGSHRIKFNPDKDMTLHYYESLPQHPNGMRFTVFDAQGDMLATNEYFSIGGGFVVNEKTQVAHGENVFYRDTNSRDSHHVSSSAADSPPAASADAGAAEPSAQTAQLDERTMQDLVTAALPFRTSKDLIELCEREQLSIAEVVFLNELQWRSREEVIDAAYRIWNVMDDSIRRGCLSTERKLPGRLNVHRRAPHLYQNLMRGIYGSAGQGLLASSQSPSLPGGGGAQLSGVFKRRQRARRPVLPQLDYLSVYAIAVNEENAAGGRVVTAPTNGAAGVIPAVLKYHLEFLSEDPSRDILEFLFTSAAIGMLYKRGASISAAEMGCQGEVGVACSMSAAAFAAVMGGTPSQVENAAEIGMEHNLGLTCDPVDGLVQIPCIERNALGAVKAVTAAQLALQGDGSHRVTLDQVIETMRQTGQDMMSKYKETSQGGLAVNVPVC
ncbi:L-serine ammonia-lyase [Martensiomyces pterosporus]|nr:L-serine ammonia-lyase [Martensiomyces pterosporus]